MVVIIMGVSGSGKTTVGQTLAARLGWRFQDADNWHSPENIAKMRSGQPLADADRAPWLRRINGAIREWVAQDRNVVLACSALKRSYRTELREGIESATDARFVYLKGEFEAIKRRMLQRHGHFMPESLLRSQFAALEEPDAAEALAGDASQPVPVTVDAVIAALHLNSA